MTLTQEEQLELIRVAREAITAPTGPGKERALPPYPSEIFEMYCGAFVSIYVEGDLRGCIGTFSEEHTLYQNIRDMAVSAATTDTRFKPLTLSELNGFQLEISVLSPKIRIFDKSEIVLGKHGIFMRKGTNRGTLLPQVAESQGWSVEEFLGNCARYKAGIGWDGWQTAELYTYEATVFRSDDL
jgi:AmmeMemoRadiSam system protein A